MNCVRTYPTFSNSYSLGTLAASEIRLLATSISSDVYVHPTRRKGVHDERQFPRHCRKWTHDVQVVRKNRIGRHIDCKDISEYLKSLPNPFPAIGVIIARFVVNASQGHPPHAALHDMANRNLVRQK
jgi:hypothetical protein